MCPSVFFYFSLQRFRIHFFTFPKAFFLQNIHTPFPRVSFLQPTSPLEMISGSFHLNCISERRNFLRMSPGVRGPSKELMKFRILGIILSCFIYRSPGCESWFTLSACEAEPSLIFYKLFKSPFFNFFPFFCFSSSFLFLVMSPP